MAKTDKSSRIVEAYSALQALGKRVKATPFAYSASAANRLEKRAANALYQAEQQLLATPTKELAFAIVKASGGKVKRHANDYSSSSSLLRRARAISTQDIVKHETEYKHTASRIVTTTKAGNFRYDTYGTKTNIDLEPELSLLLAARIIGDVGSKYDRAQVVLGGYLKPYFDQYGGEHQPLSLSYISGPMSYPPSAAVNGYRPYEERFIYVNAIQVIFKTKLL